MADRPIFFLHIPKTAGLSLRWAMVNSFPINRVAEVNSERELWDTDIGRLRELAFLSGHAHFGFRKIFRRLPFIFTFLRSPFKRTVSAYWHIRSEDVSRFPDRNFQEIIRECQRRPLEEILLDPESPVLGQLANIQTAYLAGFDLIKKPSDAADTGCNRLRDHYDEPARPDPLTLGQKELECAKAALDAIPLFGLVEEMEKSLEAFRKSLGFQPTAMPVINVRKVVTSGHELSNAAVERIEELTEYDSILYEYAVDRFSSRFVEMSAGRPGFQPFSASKHDSTAPLRFERKVSEGFIGGGWYPRDTRDESAWSWTGLLDRAWIDFCIDVRGDLEITLNLKHCLDWNIAKNLSLSFNGQSLSTRFRKSLRSAELQARLPSALTGTGPKILRIEIPPHKTIVPSRVRKKNADDRNLGIAMESFRVIQ